MVRKNNLLDVARSGKRELRETGKLCIKLNDNDKLIGVVSQIDKPRSPAGEAKGDFHSELFGRSQAQRELFRANVLKVSLDDLKRVTESYLQPENASIGVITNASYKDDLAALGLAISEL